MHCESCVSKVQQALKSIEGVNGVSVSLSGQTANVAGEGNVETMLEAVSKIGYKASVINKVEAPNLNTNEEVPVSDLQNLFPLFLIFLYISISSVGMNFPILENNEVMLDFMGLFYIVFSFFKFLDYKNFPQSFAMYDPIAMRVPFYGWVYPFIEATFGILILFRIGLFSIILITIAMLGVTSIGVTKVLLQKSSVQCACVGTALKLPMTKATFIENSIMIIMAITLLLSQSI